MSHNGKAAFGDPGPQETSKVPRITGREVNWVPQACGLCHARSASRPLDASSSDLLGSENEA